MPFIVQCSLMEPKNQKNAFELRDVPMQARGMDEGLRSRILVLPFLSDNNTSPMVLEELRTAFTKELFRTKQFVVVSPSDLKQDPKKMMTDKNEYDMQQIARIAAAQGITAVVEGKVIGVEAKRLGDSVGVFRESKARVNADVRIRIFGGRSGREMFQEQKTAVIEASSTRMAFGDQAGQSNLREDSELVRQGLKKGFFSIMPNFTKAMEKLSWEGRVAMISGERVFINAGRLSGLQMGDILKVTEEGDEVYDPETGRFIGLAPGRMKGTVEVIGYFGKDGAIAIIHSGSGFRENDRLELY